MAAVNISARGSKKKKNEEGAEHIYPTGDDDAPLQKNQPFWNWPIRFHTMSWYLTSRMSLCKIIFTE